MSLLWAVVFAVSVLIRRPMVGYMWSWATGRDRGWRDVPRAVYAFDIATLGWMLVFAARFVVQRLLYDADQTGWLGVARIGMGWPLTALAALLTYAAIKAAQRAMPASDNADDSARSDLATSAAPSSTPTPAATNRPSWRAFRQQQLAQILLDLGDRDEQQLVATFQRFVGLRHDDSRPAQDRHQRGIPRQLQPAHRLAAPRRVVGQGDLDQVGLTLAELHQSHQVADGDGLLDQRSQHARSGHRHVHTPGVGEQPFVAGIVDPGHHPGYRELGFGQQAEHHVDLVVAGSGDHHVEILEVYRLQQAQLAGIAQPPVRGRDGVDVDVVGVALDQGHVVAVLRRVRG